MRHFWLIVATSLLLGIILSAFMAYVFLEYTEHQLVNDLKEDFDQWLKTDFEIAHKMPWPETPDFSDPSFSKGTALWLIKAVVEAYAIRYNPSYKPAVPTFGKKPHRFVTNREFAGYGVFSDDGSTILLAFHGTSDVADVMQDLQATQVPFSKSNPTAKVFGGLFSVTTDLQAEVLEWLSEKTNGRPRLIISGHSSGAALAVYLGAQIKDLDTVVYTFASPKLGNHAFQRLIQSKWPELRHHRVVNSADVIPTMPIGTKANQYWPSGDPVITYLETGQTSLNHGLSTYARALEANTDE